MGEIVEGSPLITAKSELENVNFSKETVRLLIITDQKGSARLPRSEVAKAARAHFDAFFSLLKDFLGRSIKTYLVKNIGDSLMIHLECRPADIPDVLSEILTAQSGISAREPAAPFSVDSDKPTSPIRIGVFLIDDKYVVEGDNIASDCDNDLVALGVLPPKRPLPLGEGSSPKVPTWLSGDLFGPTVALAFRASQLSSSTLLTVGESVVEKLRGTEYRHDNSEFALTASGGKTLFFGEALPFSPLKGFEKPQPQAGWSGHFLLRAVTFSKDSHRAKKLALEQQKFRAWGRMIWHDVPSEDLVARWNKKLRELAGSASYLRTVSRVEDECHKPFPQPMSSSRNKSRNKRKPPKNARHGRDLLPGTLPVGFIFAFASPNELAFNDFRQKLIKEQEYWRDQFICALSTICFSPSDERESDGDIAVPPTDEDAARNFEGLVEFWPKRLKEVDWFVLLFGRLRDRFREKSAVDFVDLLEDDLQEHGELEVVKYGRTIGGEWDVYVCLAPPVGANPESRKLSSKFKKTLKELPSRQVYTTAAFLCNQEAFKSFAKEGKTGAVSPDNLSPAI